MNKKTVLKIMAAMVLFMSFLLCDNSAWNTGKIEAYALTDKTGVWEYFPTENGALSEAGGIYISAYLGKDPVVEIPSEIDGYTVTEISEYAFDGRSDLTSITIPKSVTHIGDYAFCSCKGLTSIIIPESVIYIGQDAFANCGSLESIVVDEKNKVFDSRDNCNAIIQTATNRLWHGCKNTVIPKSITSIEDRAFDGCIGLTSITIPENVKIIHEEAFYGCSNLKSATLSGEICINVFVDCTALTNVVISEHVTKIAKGIFVRCNNLTNIVVDKNNKVYDSRNNCNAVIEKSSKKLVVGCKNTVIPKGTKKIGDYAFSGCSDLKSITIPDSVKKIGNNAFNGLSKKFIIYSSDGSYAQKYAREKKITWRDSNSGSIDTFLITVGKTTYTYNGKSKKPSVTVEMGGKKLKKGTDYTVKYVDNVKVGTAKVIISGKGNYSGTITKTFTINPSKVKDVKQKTAYYSNAIILTWKKMPGVDGYKIYRATSEDGKYKKVATVKKPTYKNNKLKPAKTYYYKVYAYKSKIKGEFSDVVTAGTKTKSPTFTVETGEKTATLTWKSVTGADGYEVYMKTGKSGKYKKVKTVKADTTVFTKSELAKGKNYSFKIRTFRMVSGKKIYSDWSKVKSVKIK